MALIVLIKLSDIKMLPLLIMHSSEKRRCMTFLQIGSSSQLAPVVFKPKLI